MQQEPIECFSLDTRRTITMAELADCCGMSAEDLDELVGYNALEPLSGTFPEPAFSAQWVVPLRAASRLRLDFDLDLFTVAMLLEQLVHIELLERQVQSLQALVPARLRPALAQA